MRIIICMGLFSVLFGCKTQKPVLVDVFPALRYEFKDGSVPPKFHRSYIIEVDEEGNSTLNIHSYGDPLHEDSRKLSKTEMNDLKDKFNDLGKVSTMKRDMKTGGKSKVLKASSGAKSLLDLTWNNETTPAMETLINSLKKLYPNLASELAK